MRALRASEILTKFLHLYEFLGPEHNSIVFA